MNIGIWKGLGLAIGTAAWIAILGFIGVRAMSSDSDTQADFSAVTPAPTAQTVSVIGAVTPARPTTSNSPPRIEFINAPPADESVLAALHDGVVTRAEYDRAVANTMACLDAKGVQHSIPAYDEASRQYRYSVMDPAGPGGLSPYDECWMRYERDIQAGWVRANPPGRPAEVLNEAGAVACAVELGMAVRTFDDLIALKRAHPQDPDIQHCYVIGTMGFDPSIQRNP